MRNRDYFTRPNQETGRSRYDYGRTGKITGEPDPWWPAAIIAALVIAVYFIWEFSR